MKLASLWNCRESGRENAKFVKDAKKTISSLHQCRGGQTFLKCSLAYCSQACRKIPRLDGMHNETNDTGSFDTHFGRLSHFLTDHLPLVRLVLFDRLTKLHRLCDVRGGCDNGHKRQSGSYLIFSKFRVVHILRKLSVRRGVVLPNPLYIAYLIPMLLDTALGSGRESLRQKRRTQVSNP